VTYGNGRFVAVSGDNKAARSEDGGATWKAAAMPDGNWVEVAYGNGGFVAVGNYTGNYSKIAWSADGATWITRTASGAWSSGDQLWNSITYGNDRFVAVGRAVNPNGHIAAWSTDGVTWTLVTIPGPGPVLGYTGITYGNGRFVGVGTTSFTTGVYSGWSADGVTWTTQTIPDGIGPYVAYGKGKFVTIEDTNKIAWSADGATWTKVTTTVPAGAGYVSGIAYGEP
jgi:hypothetical protein